MTTPVNKALGLLPHDRTDDKLVHVEWAAGRIPTFEVAVDRLSLINIGLDRNDELGDCGPTSGDNHRRITTKVLLGTEEQAAIEDVLSLYAASSKPPFNPATGENDNGVMMPDLLGAMRSKGLGKNKIVAYGRLRDMSNESIYAAIDLFGAVLFAVTLQTAQQEQSDQPNPVWDYQQTPVWGGHAVVAGAYDSRNGRIRVGSWGMAIDTTPIFRKYQLDEVWVPIWPELIGDSRFVTDVDTAAMAAAFHTLTGGTLPVPEPVPPAPTPEPTPHPDPNPGPGGAPFQLDILDVAVRDHIVRSAARAGMTIHQWGTRHFEKYFKEPVGLAELGNETE